MVAGASSGIGAAIVKELARSGANLYVCARRADRLSEVTENNTLAIGYRCDVSKEDQVIKFAGEVTKRTPRIDALINCAGGFGSIGRTVDTNSHEWFKTVETILFGTYLMIKHIAPMMSGGPPSRIINFAGGGAFGPFPNYSAYAVSKAAVVRLTENLAIELEPDGIFVNAVAPGFVATEIHEATLNAGPEIAGSDHFEHTQRLMSELQIPVETPVGCVSFLLSDAANKLTGKTISASFDPWGEPEFADNIDQINTSDLYTQRRINLVNIPEYELKNHLISASKRKDPS